MLTPQLSVIIPTFNRREILIKTLKGYAGQTAPSGILEILVVDDCSTDGTAAAVAEFSAASPIPIRCVLNPSKGPAAARNFGIRAVKGDLILLGDDDIIPATTLVAEHLAANRDEPAENCAAMGVVKWSPEIHATPFQEWLGTDGVLFGFGRLAPGQVVSPHFCYFCNTSVKKSFLIREGMFDENFKGYGYEDIELAYRLIQRGLQVRYHPSAIGYHYKRLSYAEACRRQEMMCESTIRFETTEAGRALKDEAAHAKPPTLKRRLMLATAKLITPLLAPLIPLLDTHVPLPRIVYSLIYFFHVAPRAQAKFDRSRQQGLEARVD